MPYFYYREVEYQVIVFIENLQLFMTLKSKNKLENKINLAKFSKLSQKR